MTKKEAKEAIENGEKLTHRFFEPEEFITLAIDGTGRYVTEDGFLIQPAVFWKDRANECFNEGWEIFNIQH